jgi:hypothetical protein
VGLSKECDALVVVVSEETGSIRLAERGHLSEPLSIDQLRDELETRLTRGARAVAGRHDSHAHEPTPREPPPLAEANQETVHGEPAVRDR